MLNFWISNITILRTYRYHVDAAGKVMGFARESIAALRGRVFKDKEKVHHAKHDYSHKPKQYSEPGKKMEEAYGA